MTGAATAAGLLRDGRFEEAAELCRQRIAEAPDDAAAWRVLVDVARRVAGPDVVAALLRHAAETCPRDPGLANDLGVALRAGGDGAGAEAWYRRALDADPLDVAALGNLAVVRAEAGDLPAARRFGRLALAARPDHGPAHYNLANALKDMGDRPGAVAAFRRALAVDDGHAGAWNNLGVVLTELGRAEEAADACRAAIRLAPDLAFARYNLANALKALKRVDEAAAVFRTALACDPAHAQAHNNLGVAVGELGDGLACIAACRRALALEPAFGRAWYNIANACRATGRHADAVASYRRALVRDPAAPETFNNLGVVFNEQGRDAEALAAYARALILAPDDVGLHLNLAFAHLLRGRFAQGWAEFEWRWLSRRHRPHRHAKPLWDGTPAPDRTLLLHAEQGLGDTLQFIRYAAWARARVGRVVVACQRPLVPVVSTAPGVDHALAVDEVRDGFDLYAPLMALPRLHGTVAETIPATVPYLRAEPGRVALFRDRLAADGPAFRVGIVWQGNPDHVGDRMRSIPLDRFAALAAVPGVRLYGLQQGFGREQLDRVPFPVVDLSPHTGDFRDLAAAMLALDLVVCCDTSVAHAAGALAAPVWCALPMAPDWRWREHVSSSAWYPTLRLFRQRAFGDWDEVFARIADALAIEAAATSPAGTAAGPAR